jgi:hypothetical protein
LLEVLIQQLYVYAPIEVDKPIAEGVIDRAIMGHL